ncbi:LacI family DNA-binding transcriptional regulator [Novosphingobium flavum]|uniref:LacI family DNA-binding transcriptional regulator n=1 Tax=Novosphingobium flavum TaxID=1778672 RepID=A0A7X1FST8_9SPHN|nr:LacI family DNA-binding transcriptional regulator [Novosphingobium flavum]MBC2666331.1 LacI family DNA-binding transcriptional regulator [Novosphingobium flavum]
MGAITAREAKPTINDVAREAGVSKKTVSRVINRSPLLNDATREKVEKVIAALGYVPNPQARALALRRNFLIGLIHDNPNAQTVLNVQEGILSAIRDTEFALVVRPVNRRSPRMLDDVRAFLEQQRLFGVLLMPPISENDELARVCEELGVGYVRMGSAQLDSGEHLVESNDREAVRKAMEYLVALGHRRIAFVAGPEGFRSARERELGYRDAVKAAGLPQGPELEAAGNYTFETGKLAGDKLLDATERPTAIYSCNDEMAAGVLHAARERGLSVPDDLSIVGFDDSPIAAHIWPPLTTVRWPVAAMARTAALKLIDPGHASGQPALFPSIFIERGSAAPPRR